MSRLSAKVYYTGTRQTGQCSSIPSSVFIGSTPNVTYTYDTLMINGNSVANGIERLLQVTNGNVTETVTGFDGLGRPLGSMQTFAGGSPYIFSYAYNLAGGLKSITYPSGRQVAMGFDGANRVNAVSGTLNSVTTNYVSGVAYAPHGGLSAYQYKNMLGRANTYNNRLQITESTDTVTNATNPLLDLKYYYGGSATLNGNSAANNGNPTQSIISALVGTGVMNFTQTYTYDAASRLTGASENTGWSEQFGHDQWGNTWLSNSSSTNLFSQPLMPAANTAFTPATGPATNRLLGGSYDSAGNQLALGGAYTFTYDAESRQVSSTNTSSGAVTNYAYDGLGQRVSKTTGSLETWYVYDAFGNLTAEYGSSGTGGQLPCTTCYLSWDATGSTRMVTDGSANVQARHDFLPYGPELPAPYGGRTSIWGTGDNVSQKYTGQERDPETVLDFFQARYYGNMQGRFMSPDPWNASADLANPQSWNGYSYVFNSPMALVDPSGLDPSDDCDDDPDSCGYLGLVFPWGWAGATGGTSAPPDPSPEGTMQPNSTGAYGQLDSGGGSGTGLSGSSFVDPDSIEEHHIFVQQLRGWFEAQGIDIDKYLISLPAGLHRLSGFGGLHTGKSNWNALWREFQNQKPFATRQEMFDYGKQLIKRFGIGSFPGGTLDIVPFVILDPCILNPNQSYCYKRKPSQLN